LQDIYGLGKGLNVTDKQSPIQSDNINTHKPKAKFCNVNEWTSAESSNMLKVWLVILAIFFKKYFKQFKFIISITNFILIASYYSHT